MTAKIESKVTGKVNPMRINRRKTVSVFGDAVYDDNLFTDSEPGDRGPQSCKWEDVYD